jgi:hypothetical protein
MRFNGRVRKELLLEAAIFAYGVAAAALFYGNNLLVLVLMLLGWLLGVLFWHKRHDVYFFLSGVLVGVVVELTCVHFGTWSYANPTVLGIPIWLPLAWGLFTMLIKRIAETFVTIESR